MSLKIFQINSTSQVFTSVITKKVFPLILIFLLSLTVYFLSNPHPRDWYKHYVFLANSFLLGRFDVPDLPSFYHDKIIQNNHTYLLFPPAPAFLLLPLVSFWGTNLNQVFVSMLLGALNTTLVFIPLSRLGINFRTRLYLTLFFGFGTVHFYAATIGTTWYFAHVAATFFLLLALIEVFGQKRPFLLGVFLGMAILSRQTIFLSLPFFFIFLKRDTSLKEFSQRAFLFLLGLTPFFLFEAYYNFTRFGNIFDDGHYATYLYYTKSGIPHSLFPNFGFLSPFNIPFHLYTFFLMPPEFLSSFPFLRPSPYGMSVVLTSPLLAYALLAKKDFLVGVSWLAVLLVAAGVFSHFSQGWVQFGYRFLLDFLPFLLILVAKGIGEITPFKIFLLFWSIIVNSWGVYWGKILGW